MQIYEALKKDHVKVKALFTDLCSGKNDTATCKKLVAQIRDALIPHARAEEAILYNAMRELSAGSGMAWRGYTEHVEAETLLRTLQTMEAFGVEGLAVAKKLQKALDHHVAEEEGDFFTAAKKMFLDVEAEQMGEAFEKMKPGIKEESIVGTTWELVVNLLPDRLRESFRKSQPRTS